MTLHGHDISHWQGPGNPMDGDFVIAKATDGTGLHDDTYASHMANAIKAGKLFGSYHYAEGDNPTQEADFYVSNARHRPGDIMALDYEGKMLTIPNAPSWALTFLTRVLQRTGVRPLLYLQASALQQYDWTSVVHANFGLWLAKWGTTTPLNVAPWSFWAMWQTGDGSGKLDSDVFNGDRAAWLKYGGQSNPAPVHVPTPTPVHSYIVRSGENLSVIAERLHTTWQHLATVNHLPNPNLVFPGQVLHY